MNEITTYIDSKIRQIDQIVTILSKEVREFQSLQEDLEEMKRDVNES